MKIYFDFAFVLNSLFIRRLQFHLTTSSALIAEYIYIYVCASRQSTHVYIYIYKCVLRRGILGRGRTSDTVYVRQAVAKNLPTYSL